MLTVIEHQTKKLNLEVLPKDAPWHIEIMPLSEDQTNLDDIPPKYENLRVCNVILKQGEKEMNLKSLVKEEDIIFVGHSNKNKADFSFGRTDKNRYILFPQEGSSLAVFLPALLHEIGHANDPKLKEKNHSTGVYLAFKTIIAERQAWAGAIKYMRYLESRGFEIFKVLSVEKLERMKNLQLKGYEEGFLDDCGFRIPALKGKKAKEIDWILSGLEK